ncbi:MAG: hypothetical protein AMS18_13790 [Gemmatimonas sp. SG8_17]|nr:MAG: hypothetical protein AMS18_13790 [Gemmatimonas sp. SG8_17]
MRRQTVGAVGALLVPLAISAQEPTAQWQRRTGPTQVPVTVFHSPQSANLPTAETLRGGEFQFEISHRFVPPISNGADDLWGLDGPVVNRLGLAYGLVDRAMLTFQRSNLDDNWDLNLKIRVYEANAAGLRFMTAALAGAALNTGLPDRDTFASRNFQYYGMLVVNAMVGEHLALGVAPAYLQNPLVEADSTDHAFSVGLYGQVYVTTQLSFLAEWNLSQARETLEHDAVTFGFELETGGHFFKLLLTNSTRMNPAQFLGGTPYQLKPEEWRLGFNITRLLRF